MEKDVQMEIIALLPSLPLRRAITPAEYITEIYSQSAVYRAKTKNAINYEFREKLVECKSRDKSARE